MFGSAMSNRSTTPQLFWPPRGYLGQTSATQPRGFLGQTSATQPRGFLGQTSATQPRGFLGQASATQPRGYLGQASATQPRGYLGQASATQPRGYLGQASATQPRGYLGQASATQPRGYLGQTSAAQQESASALGQPAFVFVQAAPSFEQPGQAASAFGQVALARQPALVIGQQLEAGIGTGNHPVNESDIEALMPKLHLANCYTKPTIEELAARERVEPGYCSRVKDFVLGCHGVGSIRFLGETDLRWVNLDYIFAHNPRNKVSIIKTLNEVGCNGMAEITCLGEEKYSHESMRYCRDTQKRAIKNVEYYKKLAEGRGWEFVSYDPISGECKYRLTYFSGFGYIGFNLKGKVGLAWRIKNLMRRIKKLI